MFPAGNFKLRIRNALRNFNLAKEDLPQMISSELFLVVQMKITNWVMRRFL